MRLLKACTLFGKVYAVDMIEAVILPVYTRHADDEGKARRKNISKNAPKL